MVVLRNAKQVRPERFFAYFRQRLANVQEVAGMSARPVSPAVPPSFMPEHLVLLASLLDSLAMYWGLLYLAGDPPHGVRMHEFLLKHADARIFAKCSIPILLRRVTPAPADLLKLLPPDDGRTHDWTSDPDFRHVANLPSVASSVPARTLEKARYGEVLYSDFRCDLVHEYQLNSDVAADSFDPGRSEPWYLNLHAPTGHGPTLALKRLLVFPPKFLESTTRAAIDSFESACAQDGTIPVVP